ncbi:MAG: hypothetical protein IPO91_20515 [Chloroflexi bacterium]|nr:hypothetical protein [Chloroflexota bacterium]
MLQRLVIVTLLFLLVAIPAFAQEDTETQDLPNDPYVNDAANACLEGGAMEYRCHTELEWQAGWYLIRFQVGMITRAQVPDWVAWVLPPEIVEESAPISLINYCALAWNPNFYVDFTNSNFVNSGNYWSDPACTIPNGNLSRRWVYSPSGEANATSICVANLGAGYIAVPSHGSNVFECVS